MQFICEDHNNTKWFFCEEELAYYKKHGVKVVNTVLGHFLPNPDLLWSQRIGKLGKGKDHRTVKPQPATYKLWEHWNGIKHK